MSESHVSRRSSRLPKSVRFAALPDEPVSSQASEAGEQSATTGTGRGFHGGQFGSTVPRSRSPTWPSSAHTYDPANAADTSESGTAGGKRRAKFDGAETTAPKRRSTGSGPPSVPSGPGGSAYQGPVVDGETAAQFENRMRQDFERQVSISASNATGDYWDDKAQYDARDK